MSQGALEGMPVALSARNATLGDLAALLQEQHVRKYDVVAPAGAIHGQNGLIRLTGTEVAVDVDGVSITEGLYRPTEVADEGLAEKLQVPVAYLKRLRKERPDLYDANVNGWLHGKSPLEIGGETLEPGFPGDGRSFLVRCFRGAQEGVCRAFLSQSFRIVDNLDVLTATLEGVRATGMNVNVVGCDLTERRMYVKIAAPEVAALAPTLLKDYRSPWGQGQAPWDRAEGLAHGFLKPTNQPVVFAGFVISNSETGGGAFTITPRLVIQICSNGMTITKDALRSVHLGGKMDDGVIQWSDATQRKNLELVTSQAQDAVGTFLDVEYVKAKIAEIEEKAGKRIEDPLVTVTQIGKTLRFTEQRTKGVLDHFIKSGDPTAGGLMNAVTSYAQDVPDADEAFELEAVALRAFELAAA